MLILTSVRSEIATDEELKDTSFEKEENNDETNKLEIKTEDITVNDHDENEIDIKINNIVDGADVSNSTGCEPAALPITSTKCSQDFQVFESGSKGGDNGLNIQFLRVSDFGYWLKEFSKNFARI